MTAEHKVTEGANDPARYQDPVLRGPAEPHHQRDAGKGPGRTTPLPRAHAMHRAVSTRQPGGTFGAVTYGVQSKGFTVALETLKPRRE